MTETERMMLKSLEEARKMSITCPLPVCAMSNGKAILITITDYEQQKAKENGYWTAAIFENGWRMEA